MGVALKQILDLVPLKENLVLTIPKPHRKDIGVDHLTRILKRAGITREEWLKSR